MISPSRCPAHGATCDLRKTTANPGSLLWLVEDRPHPELEAGCEGFDDYKYGLGGKFIGYASNDVDRLGRDGIVSRYMKRNVHYAWGLVSFQSPCSLEGADFWLLFLGGQWPRRYSLPSRGTYQTLLNPITRTSMAHHGYTQTQGATHLERGQNFDKMLHDQVGMSDSQTIDYIPGASHNAEEMMFSEMGLDKNFVFNYNGTIFG